MLEQKEYNGWTNYETWNVALWIGNDEGLYEIALELANEPKPYEAFIAYMRELGEDCGDYKITISVETPDKVAWADSGINRDELDEMIRESA